MGWGWRGSLEVGWGGGGGTWNKLPYCISCSSTSRVNENNSNTTMCSKCSVLLKPVATNWYWRMLGITNKYVNTCISKCDPFNHNPPPPHTHTHTPTPLSFFVLQISSGNNTFFTCTSKYQSQISMCMLCVCTCVHANMCVYICTWDQEWGRSSEWCFLCCFFYQFTMIHNILALIGLILNVCTCRRRHTNTRSTTTVISGHKGGTVSW